MDPDPQKMIADPQHSTAEKLINILSYLENISDGGLLELEDSILGQPGERRGLGQRGLQLQHKQSKLIRTLLEQRGINQSHSQENKTIIIQRNRPLRCVKNAIYHLTSASSTNPAVASNLSSYF